MPYRGTHLTTGVRMRTRSEEEEELYDGHATARLLWKGLFFRGKRRKLEGPLPGREGGVTEAPAPHEFRRVLCSSVGS